MNDNMQTTKSKEIKKESTSDLLKDHLFIDITKTHEENIEKIISKDISENKRNISKLKIIYNLLSKVNNFKEFMSIYNIKKELIYEILSIGILKSFKKNEMIYKKYTVPEYYFLVLAGSVSFQNSNEQFFPGNFFGEKYLILNKRYRMSCYSNKDNTILLLIQKEYFHINLKNIVLKGKDSIKLILLKSFKIFQMIERKTLDIYIHRMVKLFPSSEEIIVSTKDDADAIFLIYDGSCTLNNEKQGDILILEKGDIFGNESLNCINEHTKLKKTNCKYKYNIKNKSQNSIIFKFFIKDLSKYIINGMKTYLAPYFKKRDEIVKNYSTNKKVIKNDLQNEYDLFKNPNKKEIIDKYCFNKNIITTDKIKKSFNNVLLELRLNRKLGNFKKKLISTKSNYVNKNPILMQKFFQKNKNKTSFNSPNKLIEINDNNTPKSRPKGELRKMIWFIEDDKVNRNKNKIKLNKKKNFNNILYTNSNFNYSSKLLTLSDNNNNNNNSNLYLTSINQRNKRSEINKLVENNNIESPVRPLTNKERTINTESSYHQNNINRRLISSALSSNRWSTSFKSNSKIMSVRKQIETYGCTILDTMSYFNSGINDTMLKRNYSAKYKKRNTESQKNFFYQTQKYNIPLYVLCDKKEKIKFPEISNF